MIAHKDFTRTAFGWFSKNTLEFQAEQNIMTSNFHRGLT